MIKELLKRFGYHKINDLDTGGWCGICGKWMEKEIFTKDEDKFWRVSICDECKSR